MAHPMTMFSATTGLPIGSSPLGSPSVVSTATPTQTIGVTLAPGQSVDIAGLIALKPASWAGADVAALSISEVTGGDANVTLSSGVITIGPGSSSFAPAPWAVYTEVGTRIDGVSIASPAGVTTKIIAILRKI
jgi:hypothetical protein